MKQHTTNEQLGELGEGEARELNKWLLEKGYTDEEELDLARALWPDKPESCLLPLSIGQMIEFLGGDLLEIKNNVDDGDWCVHLRSSDTCKPMKTLCDTLWEAVKEVLES